MNEARAIAALNHPNICTLFDVGPNYLVMEFIEGVPLAGPMTADKAFTHRDLKSANILVTKQGVKALDFGLAKQKAVLKGGDETLTGQERSLARCST